MTPLPTVAEALEFARDLPADCYADRCLLVLRAEIISERDAFLALREQFDDAMVKFGRAVVDLTERAEKAERELAEAHADAGRTACNALAALQDVEERAEKAEAELAAIRSGYQARTGTYHIDGPRFIGGTEAAP